jgi:hypothetical protein
MQLFRLFCIYFPTKDAVKHDNVDNDEQLQILVSYAECLKAKCVTERKKNEFLRKRMKEKILEKLLERNPFRDPENTDGLSKDRNPQISPATGNPRFPSIAELNNDDNVQQTEEDEVAMKVNLVIV